MIPHALYILGGFCTPPLHRSIDERCGHYALPRLYKALFSHKIEHYVAVDGTGIFVQLCAAGKHDRNLGNHDGQRGCMLLVMLLQNS